MTAICCAEAGIDDQIGRMPASQRVGAIRETRRLIAPDVLGADDLDDRLNEGFG